jgi:hypothetical protein
MPVAALREERGDLVTACARREVEVFAVVETVSALDGFEQRLVGARGVDPRREPERLLEMIGLTGREDALPLADALETGASRVPDRDVLGLGTCAEGASQVEEEDVVGVLRRPAVLPAPGGEVERLDRDSGPAADVLDVDEQLGLTRPRGRVGRRLLCPS